MKKFVLSLAFLSVLFVSCSDDDDSSLDDTLVENQEEEINEARIFLTNTNDDTDVVTLSAILEEDGEEEDVVVTGGTLSANTVYTGSWELTAEEMNDTRDEIAEEDDDHQFFFLASEGLNIEVAYNDADDLGNPLGLMFTLTTGEASEGTLNIRLSHLLTKTSPGILDGDITEDDVDEAGGETEFNEDFELVIEEEVVEEETTDDMTAEVTPAAAE